MSIILSWSISSTISDQCSHQIETSQLICKAVSNQLTVFYMKTIIKAFHAFYTVVARIRMPLSKRVKTFRTFGLVLPIFCPIFALVFVAFSEILPLPS